MPNQKEYLAKKSLLDTKQDTLTAGANININNNNVISVQGLPKDVKVDGSSVVDINGNANIDLTGKQDALTAGDNITIQNNVISANIEANPQDTPTADLDSINIDGTVYNIAGSGGTSVIPNPAGTPTEILETVSIEGTIYDIPGSGSGAYNTTLLWSGPNTVTMELSESFRHFDAIMFTANATYNGSDFKLTSIWSKQDLQAHINDGVKFCAAANDAWFTYFTISNNTTFVRTDNYYLYISEIKGVKYGAGGGGSDVEANPASSPTETLNTIGIDGVVYDIPGSGGSGGPTASGLQKTLLWDYVNDNNSVIPYNVYSVTLHDDINNYDAIILELVSYSGDLNGSWRATNIQNIFFVDELNNTLEPNAVNLCTFSQRSTRFYIHDNIVSTTINNENSTNGLVKVYGLRFNIGGISDNYEVNNISIGDGTNSRTFTFPKTPRKVSLQGYTSGDGGWYESTWFIWGENFMTLYGHQGTAATGGYVGQAGITYGADGRSFTINAANSFGAFNRADNFTGKILAEYSGGAVNDISGMTWTLLDSTTSRSTAVAIPSDAQYIVCMAEMTGGTEAIEVAKICLAEVNKLLLTTNKTSWVKAYEWWDFSGNHTTAGVKITNGTIQCSSGYSGCTTSIYAVS